ncbi:MAG: transketolase C-terminal domain-containing protein [Candidatus Woesearchaeota archaeon]
MNLKKFPININGYKTVKLSVAQKNLTKSQKIQLKKNILILRSSIVFMTALANAKGLGGHTGGPYDIVPEATILHSLIKNKSNKIYPVLFDEAGHRSALQYVFAAIDNYIPQDKLLHYREFNHGLYGHPEREDKKGIFFSSGRLGHLWSYVNGIAQANPDESVLLFGSDGSQQEGNDAEAARYCVAKKLNVKLLIDDNDVTISGHPSDYLNGFNVEKTLKGHGLLVDKGNGEDIESLFQRIKKSIQVKGPYALINKRKMAVGIKGLEGNCKAHDVIDVGIAIDYLSKNKFPKAVGFLNSVKAEHSSKKKLISDYLGSSSRSAKCRDEFGKIICDIISKIPDRTKKVIVIDSDLEGSCGLHHVRKNFPEVYVSGGVMERNNFSAAAGFGSVKGKQGIMGTFSAFLEMIVSEITMARLNNANVLAHFSHAGVDDIADNTCHYGLNNFFADNGLKSQKNTKLYFPADTNQMKAILSKIFFAQGLRFIFSTRSSTPFLLDEKGNELYSGKYLFKPGKDELIRKGSHGCIISYGDMLYRALDAVERLKSQGINLTLINKPTLNVVDNTSMKLVAKYKHVILIESLSENTGLGIRFGTWLLKHGFKGRYMHLGTAKQGKGGTAKQIPFQELDSKTLQRKIKLFLKEN